MKRKLRNVSKLFSLISQGSFKTYTLLLQKLELAHCIKSSGYF